MVANFRNLGSGNKSFFKVRPAAKHGGVVRRGVILTAHRGKAEQDSELADGRAHAASPVLAGLAPHLDHQVADGVVLAQQGDAFHLILLQARLFPVGVIDIADAPELVRLGQAAEAGVLVHKAVDLRAVLGEDNHRHGKEEILAVGDLLQEEGAERRTPCEAQRVRVGGGLAVRVLQGRPCAVASQDIEELVLGGNLVRPHKVGNLERQQVVEAPGGEQLLGPARHGTVLHTEVVKDARGVLHGSHDGLHAVRAEVEDFGLEQRVVNVERFLSAHGCVLVGWYASILFSMAERRA